MAVIDGCFGNGWIEIEFRDSGREFTEFALDDQNRGEKMGSTEQQYPGVDSESVLFHEEVKARSLSKGIPYTAAYRQICTERQEVSRRQSAIERTMGQLDSASVKFDEIVRARATQAGLTYTEAHNQLVAEGQTVQPMMPLTDAWLDVLTAGEAPDLTRDDLDQIVDEYGGRPTGDRAPLGLGYPDENQGVYGQVSELRRSGDKLQALVSTTEPRLQKLFARGILPRQVASVKRDSNGRATFQRLGLIKPTWRGSVRVDRGTPPLDNLVSEDSKIQNIVG
jgi:hypothetical protein